MKASCYTCSRLRFLVKDNNDRMSCATCRSGRCTNGSTLTLRNHAVPLSDQNKSRLRANFIIVLGTFNEL